MDADRTWPRTPQHPLDHAGKVKKLMFDVFVVGDDLVGKCDYLEKQGVMVVYTPYGKWGFPLFETA